MGEYSDSFKVSILTGSSKGYVDSDEDGLLAKIVKENPRAVILLDEFENGLHQSGQSKLWDIIFELAKNLDVQVFVTTHSNDCIKSFAHSSMSEDGLAIRLDMGANGLKAQLYEEPEK